MKTSQTAQQATHTPPPLTIAGPSPGLDRTIDDGGDYAIVDTKGHILGQAHHRVDTSTYANAKANATLWANAPDMLAALETVLTARLIEEQSADAPYDVRRMTMTDALDWARAVVAKAKGATG